MSRTSSSSVCAVMAHSLPVRSSRLRPRWVLSSRLRFSPRCRAGTSCGSGSTTEGLVILCSTNPLTLTAPVSHSGSNQPCPSSMGSSSQSHSSGACDQYPTTARSTDRTSSGAARTCGSSVRASWRPLPRSCTRRNERRVRVIYHGAIPTSTPSRDTASTASSRSCTKCRAHGTSQSGEAKGLREPLRSCRSRQSVRILSASANVLIRVTDRLEQSRRRRRRPLCGGADAAAAVWDELGETGASVSGIKRPRMNRFGASQAWEAGVSAYRRAGWRSPRASGRPARRRPHPRSPATA